jgi:hypothetical protein
VNEIQNTKKAKKVKQRISVCVLNVLKENKEKALMKESEHIELSR